MSAASVVLEPEVTCLGPALSETRRLVHPHPERGFVSRFLETVPGRYAFIGSSNPARGLVHRHHPPRVDFDEAALPIGVQLFVRVSERFLAS